MIVWGPRWPPAAPWLGCPGVTAGARGASTALRPQTRAVRVSLGTGVLEPPPCRGSVVGEAGMEGEGSEAEEGGEGLGCAGREGTASPSLLLSDLIVPQSIPLSRGGLCTVC